MGSINHKMLCMLLLTLAHARRMYQIRKFQEAELKRRSLRPCNATDLSEGLPGTWRLAAREEATPMAGTKQNRNDYGKPTRRRPTNGRSTSICRINVG